MGNKSDSKTNKYIVMIGPDISARGGIASVIASYKASGFFEKWPILFLPTHQDGSKLTKLRRAISALSYFIFLLFKKRIGVLHVHAAVKTSFFRKALFMSFALLARVPYLLHIHSGQFPEFYWKDCSFFLKRSIRFFLDHATMLIVLSPKWEFLLKGITANKNQRVIPNFVTMTERGTEVNPLRDQSTVLFLGRLTREKGFFDLLQAIALLRDDFPQLKLDACGDGEIKPVNELIAELGLEDIVNLRGWVEGVAKVDLINRATLFVLPSYFEGLPVCVLEAMSYGLPVVASDVGGIPDVVKSGHNGIIIKPGDINGIVSAMRMLLSCPAQRMLMSSAALDTVTNQFSAEITLGQLGALYADCGIVPNSRSQDLCERGI